MRLFGRKRKGPRSVHIGGGFSPAVPIDTQTYVRQQAIAGLMRLKPNFAELWKQAESSPKDWTVVVDPTGRDDLEALGIRVSNSLTMAAGVDVDVIDHSQGRLFFMHGSAEAPDGGSFLWYIKIYFKN